MRRVKYEDIEEISEHIVEGFSEDPQNKYQLRNIERKHFFLKTSAEIQLRKFLNNNGDVYTLDDCKGVVIGYNSRKIDFDGFIKIATEINDELMKVITEEEMQIIISNNQMLDEVDNPLWFYGICEEYYHLLAIAVDKQIRGNGAFRELISPLLKECDEKNIPVLVETHSESNVDMYRHFGFEIVKVFSNEQIEFKQYCMIRKPQSNLSHV